MHKIFGRLFVVAIISITLAGCGDTPKLWTRSEIEDIAEDFSQAAVVDSAPVIGEADDNSRQLQARVELLEAEVSRLNRMLAETNRAYDTHLENASMLAKRSDANDERLRNAVNTLGQYHGITAIPTVPQSRSVP